MSVQSLLSDDEVEVQGDRWKDAIDRLDSLMPLWHHHAARLNRMMTRGWCRTAAVDGVNLYWNPEFTASLDDRELLFLLVHEVFHVAAGHIWRGARYQKGLEGRELREVSHRLNNAADYAIHQILVPLCRRRDYKRMKFPTGKNRGLYDKRFYNMSMEKIYDFLLNNPNDKANRKTAEFDIHIFRGKAQDGEGIPEGATSDEDGNWVIVVDGDGNTVEIPKNGGEGDEEGNGAQPAPEPMDPRDVQLSVKRDLQSSGYGGNNAGKGTGNDLRTANVDPNQVKDDWGILTRFMTMHATKDYSYSRPNRSYLSRGLVAPGLRSPEVNIALVIDTSGSINARAFEMFGSNVEKIRNQLGDHVITLIFCDDMVRRVEVVSQGEKINWKVYGGGGTSFNPPFQWIEGNMSEKPSCLVYFTDGQCGGDYGRPKNAPSYPVLWALWGPKERQPWGENLELSS